MPRLAQVSRNGSVICRRTVPWNAPMSRYETWKVPPMKSARPGTGLRPTAGTWSAMAAVAVLAATAYWSYDREGGPAKEADRVTAGRLCRSTLPPDLELSCGTYGFGDLRYTCPAHGRGDERCVPTSMVTVRNSGPSRVYVTYIAGPRPGVREQGPQQALEPGREATLRPGEGRLLFDITIRGADERPSVLEVVRVR